MIHSSVAIASIEIFIITAAPGFSIQPNTTGPIVVAEGSNVKLTCEASDDSIGKYWYQWRKGTELLSTADSNNNRYSVARRIRDFTINNVTISDSGQYHCEFTDINGTNVPSFEVQVIVKSELLTYRNMFDH